MKLRRYVQKQFATLSAMRIALLAATGVAVFGSGSVRAADSVIETLFNVRGIRTSSTPSQGGTLTDFCKGLTFTVNNEDTFDLYSYRARASDGLVVNTKVQKVGTSRTCFGVFDLATLSVKTRVKYDLGGEIVEGYGSCQLMLLGPVPGSTIYVCTALLSGEGLIGGQVVSTAANGPQKIEANDPNAMGVYETTFSTFRLWR